jgi:aspartate 1-decarboxylase
VTITLLRAKIHRATVTDANLDYEGSIAIDKNLIEAAGLARYELVHVVNINNGSRLETYVIEAPAGTGTVCLNGAAARLGAKGDKIIVLAYAQFSVEEARWFKPAIVHVDKDNKVIA